MALFNKAKPVLKCTMCDKTREEGCGSADYHIEQISTDEPEWLPEGYRLSAIGEYTWFCMRCNSYPELKWPKESGASSGIMVHLGEAHGIGLLRALPGSPTSFGMRRLSRVPPPPLRKPGFNDRVQLKDWLDLFGTVGATTNAQIDPVIITLARFGGSGPADELAARVAAGHIAADWIPSLVNRPWRWMLRTAQEASRRGDRILSVRAAMFICHWAEQFGPRLGPADVDALGLGDVPSAVHVDAAVLGLSDVQHLPPDTAVAWDTQSTILARDALPTMATRLQLLHYDGKQVPLEALATAQAISARSAGR